MVKLTFLFNRPDDPGAFDEYFFEKHLPLHAAIRNVRRREIAKVFGTPDGSSAPYHLIAEYYFESMDVLTRTVAAKEVRPSIGTSETSLRPVSRSSSRSSRTHDAVRPMRTPELASASVDAKFRARGL